MDTVLMYKGGKYMDGLGAHALRVIFFLLIACHAAIAQDASHTERPKDVKIVREYEDGKGHIIRELQYKKGAMIVTETVILPKPQKIEKGMAISPDTLNKDSLIIYVDKSRYLVLVFYKRQLIRKYRAVFGPDPSQDKKMQGDRNTPEGWYTISRLNPHSKYHKYMELSYPTRENRERFDRLKARGVIPRNAQIGGNVGIHGIWEGGDNMIELGVGWTDGCIAIKNKDMDELYKLTGLGTRVIIKR